MEKPVGARFLLLPSSYPDQREYEITVTFLSAYVQVYRPEMGIGGGKSVRIPVDDHCKRMRK